MMSVCSDAYGPGDWPFCRFLQRIGAGEDKVGPRAVASAPSALAIMSAGRQGHDSDDPDRRRFLVLLGESGSLLHREVGIYDDAL